MKLRWWIVGTVAIVAGSIFVVKHFIEGKKSLLQFIDKDNEKNLCEVSPESYESEFEEVDFLA